MLVIFVGLPVGGKTTALYVAEEMGFEVVASGDVVREEIKNRGLEYTKENDKKIAAEFHEEGGEVRLVEKILGKLKGDPEKDKIAIDGLRDVVQVDELERSTGVVPYVISIIADFEVRVQRAEERARFGDIDYKKYIKERDEVENSRGLSRIMDLADVVIDTTTLTFEESENEVRKVLKTLKD